MNIFVQSVQTNVSSAQNSAAPVRNEAVLQAQVVVNTSKVIKDLTVAVIFAYVSGHVIR